MKKYRKEELAVGNPLYKYYSIKSSSVTSFITYVKGKQKCIIISPGELAEHLLKEHAFNKLYVVELWQQFNEPYLLSPLIKEENPIILIDNTCSYECRLNNKEIDILNTLASQGLAVYNINSFYEHLTGRIPLVYVSKNWSLNRDLFYVRKRKHFEFWKRSIDIFTCLVLALPALIFTAIGLLLVGITSKGPLLFKQLRVGKNGKAFYLYKIRTMVHNPKGHTAFTTKHDERIFPVGQFLRRTKIDELPQLWNVLKGDMSIVGPRPEKVDIVDKLVEENPYYSLRHIIRPGITGWAQVNNPTATPNENLEKLEYDLYYVKNISYFLELKILFRTIKVVLTLDSL